ncbi:HD domain-containing protein [Mangrovimonas cancribranchiae]|uniref:HD domain-containing protein n=1 Tax=Mangrovimonas cancribranchiae TaxID=3080055 RepID=A0AAU6PB16_9FLAO
MRASFSTIKLHVLRKLLNTLPNYLTYHSVAHTKYVLEKVIYIASKEGVTGHDLFLLKIAALYHDIGFIQTHIEHEKIGCEIVRKELPKFEISKEDIEAICGMIMATKIPQQPKTHLEEILADADLEYLGTKHFFSVSELLYQELKYYNTDLSREEWNKIQINFIENHQYHTNFCRRYKSFRKEKHLKALKMR